MPKFEIKLTLENAARKSGGDKYEGLFIHESGATASIQPYVSSYGLFLPCLCFCCCFCFWRLVAHYGGF